MDNGSLWGKILFPPVYMNEKRLSLKLRGKTILITGASFGIGEALAYLLADMNVHLVLVARTIDKLQTMKREIEEGAAKVSILNADLRNSEEIKGLLDAIHQLPEGIDILVNNAGISIRRPIFHSLDRYHDFTRTMAINYFAPVQLMLSLIPLLKKNQGHVINISTVNVLLIPFPYWAAYQASKTAFDTWFRSSAPELNAIGISTTTIYLPLVKTRMIRPTSAYQDLPAMNPYHVAKIICKAIYTQKQKYRPWWLIFGQFASIMFRGVWEFLTPLILQRGRKDRQNE